MDFIRIRDQLVPHLSLRITYNLCLTCKAINEKYRDHIRKFELLKHLGYNKFRYVDRIIYGELLDNLVDCEPGKVPKSGDIKCIYPFIQDGIPMGAHTCYITNGRLIFGRADTDVIPTVRNIYDYAVIPRYSINNASIAQPLSKIGKVFTLLIPYLSIEECIAACWLNREIFYILRRHINHSIHQIEHMAMDLYNQFDIRGSNIISGPAMYDLSYGFSHRINALDVHISPDYSRTRMFLYFTGRWKGNKLWITGRCANPRATDAIYIHSEGARDLGWIYVGDLCEKK